MTRFLFGLTTMAMILSGLFLAPAQAANAQGGPDLPVPTATTTDGGLVYTFPINPNGSSATPPANDPKLVASGVGTPPGVDLSIQTTSGIDDRENYQPVAWYVYEHQTLENILNQVSLYNLRVVDLSVESPYSPYDFTAVYVNNTGIYAKAWALFTNITPTDLLNSATTYNLRIISQKVFGDLNYAGDTRIFAVLISNTGADAKAWYFFVDQTPLQLLNFANTHTARLVQINSYSKGGVIYYDAVLISNTLADTRAWWFYVNVTPPTITSLLTQNTARLVDMDYNPGNGTYNVIMNYCPAGCLPGWWWYVNIPTSGLQTIYNQTGGRMIDATTTLGCLDMCWSFILVDNSHEMITGNTGTGGVKLTYVDGTAKIATSDVNGNYTILVPQNWSGMITPSKTGVYSFTPASRTYSSLSSFVSGQNFRPNYLMSFSSQAALDGYITESSETSSLGGSANSGSTVFNVGDDALNRQLRGLLSFNTANLPDTAVILSAKVKLKQQSMTGTNPFLASLGQMVIDIRAPYFGAAQTLGLDDFAAAASVSAGGTVPNTPVSGVYTGNLGSTEFPYVNKLGTTQLRLRFSVDDNNNKANNFISFYSSNFTTTPAYQPRLDVVYYVP